MRKSILAMACFLCITTATVAQAAPFIACDKDAAVSTYVITSGQTWLPASTVALATGTLGFKIDVAGAPVGTSSVKIKPCTTDAIWGQLCGPETTFPLVRPSAPAAMTGTGLMP
jgi:hypothetical protein